MTNSTKALLLLSSTALLFGCSSSSSPGTPDAATDTMPMDVTLPMMETSPPMEAAAETSPPPDAPADAPTDTGPTFPPPPTLGKMQIDRMGRPAVNTALTDPLGLLTGITENMAKDAYNANSVPSTWTTGATSYVPQFEASLAAFDGLDGVCGNQLGFAAMDSGKGYSTLAGALAEDSLWLNTAGTTSTQYLEVELNALGAIKTLTDTGGRGLAYDVVNITYSALILGAFTGVSDGTTPVTSKTNGLGGSTTATAPTFPYLGTPL